MNTFERMQLLNSVLLPRWMHHTLFIPHDAVFHKIDKIGLDLVAVAEGMEHNCENIDITPPLRESGLGLRQTYGAYQERYVCHLGGGPSPEFQLASMGAHCTL